MSTYTAKERLLDAQWRWRRIRQAQPREALRQRLASREERHLLELARNGRDVCWVETGDEAEPLVTVRIATYNRGQLVADRAIASALRQDYPNIEVLVIGDHCDEATERAVRSVDDPRVRFYNLAHRGIYPADPMKRWMVAGATPMNAGLYLANGAWIAPCDDDDELTDDHVSRLLKTAKAERYEMIYGKTRMEIRPGEWREVGKFPLRQGHISHGSVLYSAGLRFIRHSETSWRLGEPADWNMWRRMKRIGVRIGFLDEITYTHYVEGYKRLST